MKAAHIGSDFDDFLKREGLLAEGEAGTLKRVVARQIEQEMKRRKISRAELASRMKTISLESGRKNLFSLPVASSCSRQSRWAA
jgi:hypothetical protein